MNRKEGIKERELALFAQPTQLALDTPHTPRYLSSLSGAILSTKVNRRSNQCNTTYRGAGLSRREITSAK